MRIQVTGPNTFSGDSLIVGEEYDAVPASNGTDRQNAAFHALLREYWRFGCHSWRAINYLHFRELIKLHLGAGAERYYSLIDDNGKALEKPVVRYRIKSWAAYSKKERSESIGNLVAEMMQAGVNSKKFYEILDGMDGE